jgi:transposase
VPAPRKYPQELRDRSIRMVAEAIAEDPSLTLNQAVQRICKRVGVVPDTLHGWVKKQRIDTGQRPGTTTSDAKRIRDLGGLAAGRAAEAATGARHPCPTRPTSPTVAPVNSFRPGPLARGQLRFTRNGGHLDSGTAGLAVRMSACRIGSGRVTTRSTAGRRRVW